MVIIGCVFVYICSREGHFAEVAGQHAPAVQRADGVQRLDPDPPGPVLVTLQQIPPAGRRPDFQRSAG